MHERTLEEPLVTLVGWAVRDALVKDLSGALEDLTFMYRMGARLTGGDDWPEWSETSEFRAVREAQRPIE